MWREAVVERREDRRSVVVGWRSEDGGNEALDRRAQRRELDAAYDSCRRRGVGLRGTHNSHPRWDQSMPPWTPDPPRPPRYLDKAISNLDAVMLD